MNVLKRFFKTILSKIFLMSKLFSILLAIIFAIILIVLFRSCSPEKDTKKNVYLIGRDNSWYSLELLGREKNFSAFTNDLLAEIANLLSLRFRWMESEPTTLLKGLDVGIYDGILSGIQADAINQDKYYFSALFFELGPVLIVREDSPVKSLKEIEGLTIGVLSGSSTSFNILRKKGYEPYDFNLISYNNINRAIEALLNDQIDGIFMKALPAYTLTEGFYHGKLKIVTPPLTDEGLRIITLKNPRSKILVDEINKALEKLKNDGTYDTLLQKWNLINSEIKFKPTNVSKSEKN